MGAGIAQTFAMHGFEVKLFDLIPESVKGALEKIGARLTSLVKKGVLQNADEVLARITPLDLLNDFVNCSVVIEAVREDFEIKATLLKKLDTILPRESIIASNTSSISITKLGAATSRAEKVIGMHFMNPVPVMQLVEVIPGLATSSTTLQRIFELVRLIKKVTVRGVDTPGFIVNRILVPFVNEAIFLLQEGVLKEDIDQALVLGTNQPMGPLRLADFVGLDTLLAILRVLHDGLGEDKYRPCPLLINYVNAGWFGEKSGRGFYIYNK